MYVRSDSVEKWYFREKGKSNRFYAVHPTDLLLKPGEVTVLTGKSGSGKTTLLYMLAGVLTPSAGKVFVGRSDPSKEGQQAEQDLSKWDDEALSQFRNKHTALIPQGGELLLHLTVMENILLPHTIYKPCHLDQVKERAHGLLQKLEILDLADVPAGELSGGERRRVCVARALAGTPSIIFADEPTSDLDEENSQTVLTLLKESARGGAVVFIVTHDPEAIRYADVKLGMKEGRLTEIVQFQ